MIKTKLTREDAIELLKVGKALHEESVYRDEPYQEERVWAILDGTVTRPDKLFIAYDDEFKGVALIGMSEQYFSGVKHASDLAFYVRPEHRGGSLAVRLLAKAAEWSKANGAKDLTIYHSTGINTDKSESFFNRQGYLTRGFIFTKEL